MIIETAQWNIGGALIRTEDEDPKKPDSYQTDGLDYVISELNHHQPQIITLQEVQSKGASYNQAKIIAEALRYEYRHFALSPSHFQDGAELGISILSQFPLWVAEKVKFTNPNWTIEKPDGTVMHSHDKGMLRVKAKVSQYERLMVATTHVFPDHIFGQDLGAISNLDLLAEIRRTLSLDPKYFPLYLIQGDFNVDANLIDQAPDFAKNLIPEGLIEIPTPRPTLIGGKTVDHTFYRGMSLPRQGETPYSPKVIPTITDQSLMLNRFVLPVETERAAPIRALSHPGLLPLTHLRPGTTHRNSAAQ